MPQQVQMPSKGQERRFCDIFYFFICISSHFGFTQASNLEHNKHSKNTLLLWTRL